VCILYVCVYVCVCVYIVYLCVCVDVVAERGRVRTAEEEPVLSSGVLHHTETGSFASPSNGRKARRLVNGE